MTTSGGVRAVDELGRDELAVLVRELLLAGQLMDRAGMPHLISDYGREAMGEIAIDEWMGASPVYTRRTQQLLGFGGSTIDTLFKGLQLDIGAPPEFMDFRLRVIDEHHGEFWLDHCGALMDVEPMGEDYVRTMCHTIEDPTFDATAMATSPHARIRPIHRPPRTPPDRRPHCHWTATIDESRPALPEPEPATHMAATRLARVPVPAVDPGGEGWSDYLAPMDPDLRTEWFSRPALVGLAHEVAVQSHLLVMSFLFAIERRHGTQAAAEIGRRQLTGIAGLTSERLRDALGLDTSLAAVAQVLELHPALAPRDWVAASVSLDGPGDALRLSIGPCDAAEEEHLNWVRLLVDGHDGALDALVRGVEPHYGVERERPAAGELAAWRVVRHDEPAPESPLVKLTRFSTGADFRFRETPVELGGT
jgi:hypothetical protein